jgi:hypothetical protein
MIKQNPYRWDLDEPSHEIPRDDGGLHDHVLSGKAVRLVGGRGMGKSVMLRQLETRLSFYHDTRVLRLAQPPLGAQQASDLLADVAMRLGISSAKSMADVLEGSNGKRVVLLLDEMDQYISVDNGVVARAWLNHIEGVRKQSRGGLGVVVAGGVGLLHLGHLLGSGLMSRAQTVIARPFSSEEISDLAIPLRERRTFDDYAVRLLLAITGGNPALVTYGLQQLWDQDEKNDSGSIIESLFGDFSVVHAGFIRTVERAVSREGSLTGPARVLKVVQEYAEGVPREILRAACEDDNPPIDLAQAVEILRAAGLVHLRGSLAADVVDVAAIASVITLTTRTLRNGNQLADLVSDILSVLGEIHRFSVDFRSKDGTVEEKVFSGVLAIALTMRGWKCSREPKQAAGELDLRVDLPALGTGAHLLIETKIWPRNDYRNVQDQVSSYSVSETKGGLVVMVRVGKQDANWPHEYETKCLSNITFDALVKPPNLVGHWRTNNTVPVTDHVLVRIAER